MGKNRDIAFALFDSLEKQISATPGYAEVKLGKKARRDLLEIMRAQSVTLLELEKLCLIFLTEVAKTPFGSNLVFVDIQAELQKIRLETSKPILH